MENTNTENTVIYSVLNNDKEMKELAKAGISEEDVKLLLKKHQQDSSLINFDYIPPK